MNVFKCNQSSKLLNYLLIVILNICVLSCSRTDEVDFDISEDGYVVYNNRDSLTFDKHWNLIYSTISYNDSVSKLFFENDTLKEVYHSSKNGDYVIYIDSLLNPFYVNKTVRVELDSQSIGNSFDYFNYSEIEMLDIYSTFIKDGHILVYLGEHQLVFNNNEIDTLESVYHIVEETDSGEVFKYYDRLDINEEYYYQLIYYTDPFLELAPISIAGNLYIEDTAKHKDVLYFSEGTNPYITYDNINEKPTVFQVYIFKKDTREAFDYRLGIIRPENSNEEKWRLIKNDLSEKYNQFKNKNYLNDIERSIESFPFMSVKSEGVVKVDKKKLTKLYSKHRSISRDNRSEAKLTD